jgi:PTS system fructose-specific IIC component
VKLSECLNEKNVEVQAAVANREQVFERLVGLVEAQGRFMDPKDLLSEVLERENLGSTGIGEGVAIPHVHKAGIDSIHVAMMTAKSGVDFDAIDDKPCRIFLMVAAPDSDRQGYLRLLSEVSRLLRRESVRNSILTASTAQALLNTIRESEQA